MNKQLLFVQSCIRQGVSIDDIGYMMKDYFDTIGYEKTAEGQFFDSIKDRMDMWDQPKRITRIMEGYIN